MGHDEDRSAEHGKHQDTTRGRLDRAVERMAKDPRGESSRRELIRRDIEAHRGGRGGRGGRGRR